MAVVLLSLGSGPFDDLSEKRTDGVILLPRVFFENHYLRTKRNDDEILHLNVVFASHERHLLDVCDEAVLVEYSVAGMTWLNLILM
eukprot:scaffold190_cov171-Amphora_coffeaeformis.AAC.7